MTRPTRRAVIATGLGALLATLLAPLTAFAAADPFMGTDTDNDKILDMAEAKSAAAATFDKLDTDHDGTLSPAELKGRLSPAAFRKADPDHDGTISKDEYMALVEARFKAADPDNDAKLDSKELRTASGKALMKLLT